MPAYTRYIFRFGVYSLALSVIAFAFLVSAARMLLPLADQYRDEIESLVSESLGFPVQIGDLSAKWRGIFPSVALQDVVIYDPDSVDNQWIKLQQMELWFNPYKLLLSKNIPVNRYKITGASLSLEQKLDNSLHLNGRKISTESELSLGFLRDLLSHISAIDLEEVSLSYTRAGDTQVSVGAWAERLELFKQDNHIRVAGVLHRSKSQRGYASFIGLLPDDASTFDTANVTFHLKVDTELGDWLTPWLPGGMSLKKGYSTIQIWGNTRGLTLHDIDIQFVATDMSWQRTLVSTGEPLLPGKLKGLSTHVRWQRTDHGWTLIADPLLVVSAEKTWEPGKLVLVHHDATEDKKQSLSGSLNFLNLDDMVAWTGTWLEDFSLRERLHELALQGDLKSIIFSLQGPVFTPQQYTVNASVEGLEFRSIDGLPGLSGVDGFTQFTQSDGEIVLDSSDFRVTFPVLFRRDLFADSMSGVVRWHHDDELWQLSTYDISLINQDIEARTRFLLSKSANDEFPVLDLQSHFQNGNVENAWKYLPTGIMDTDVVAWLDRALVTGRVPNGSMIYFGALQDFPYDKHEGIFEIRFTVEDGILDYGEDWPRIDDFNADVSFIGSGFETQFVSGTIHGLEIQKALVSINDLVNSSDLEVKGYMEGPLQEAFGFIAHISENEQVRAAIRDLRAGGKAGLGLNLHLPLNDLRQFKLEGVMDLTNSMVQLPRWTADLSGLNGALHYEIDDAGGRFNADSIKGELNGQEAVISVSSKNIPKGGVRTSTFINSKIDIHRAITTYLPFDLSLQGITPVTIRIDTNRYVDKPDEINLNVQSNLKGVGIDLPDGLGKSDQDERLISLDWQLVTDSDTRSLSVAYGEDVKADLDFIIENQSATLDSGVLNIGNTYSKKPESGLSVFIDKQQLHLEQWWELMESSTLAPMSVGPGLVHEVNVHIEELIYSGNHFKNFTLAANQDDQAWMVNITSDSLQGSMRVPLDLEQGQIIEVDLKKLSWTTPESGSNARYRDPRQLPSFVLNSEQLFFNGKDMGKLAVRVSAGINGLVIDSISLMSELFTIKGTGSWSFEQNWHRSRFEFDLATADLGKVLRYFGFEDNMEEGESSAHIKAEWSGTPAEFELSRLDGDIQMTIRDGRLKDLDAGGGRVFGLLSISRLPRRLLLDFSDLFGDGFKFDKITGSFSIADGDAYTNDLSLTSSAADIEISGRIGLASQDYDQVAIVSPKMSSSLPLIGGLAGGPGLALGLWVADRLIGKQISSLGNVTYNITGSWDEPVVTNVDDSDEAVKETENWDLFDPDADEF